MESHSAGCFDCRSSPFPPAPSEVASKDARLHCLRLTALGGVVNRDRIADYVGAMAMPFSFRNDPAVPSFDDTAPIAVMDADCALCCWGARMLHRLDQSGTVRICPVQSPLGAALLRHYGLDSHDPASWLLLDQGQPYFHMEAIIRAGQIFGGWGRLTNGLRIAPRPLRNWLYQRIARNRYTLFGRGDLCALPDPEFQRRLLR